MFLHLKSISLHLKSTTSRTLLPPTPPTIPCSSLTPSPKGSNGTYITTSNRALNTSVDFVLLPTKGQVGNDQPYSHNIRFTTSRIQFSTRR